MVKEISANSMKFTWLCHHKNGFGVTDHCEEVVMMGMT
jgi:hypothetical protein